jgi:hypothetical protein
MTHYHIDDSERNDFIDEIDAEMGRADMLRSRLKRAETAVAAQAAEIAKLKAERDRLRAALESAPIKRVWCWTADHSVLLSEWKKHQRHYNEWYATTRAEALK